MRITIPALVPSISAFIRWIMLLNACLFAHQVSGQQLDAYQAHIELEAGRPVSIQILGNTFPPASSSSRFCFESETGTYR